MRFARTFVLAFLSLVLTVSLAQPARPGAQTSASAPQSSPQALPLLQQSVAALTGGKSITDVTLSGTARRIAGGDDVTGTATLKALASGAARTDLSFPSGPHSEIMNPTGTEPAGTWCGRDGVSHAMAYHNLLTEPAWFFPAFAIVRRLTTPGFVASYVGHETHNGQAVEHLAISQTAPSPDPRGGISFAHLTQIDFFLDTTTLLPAAITFNIHPDNNALLDLPVEIDFSNYTSVNGVQIPSHVLKLINNMLLLDLQITATQLNTGLPASSFNAL